MVEHFTYSRRRLLEMPVVTGAVFFLTPVHRVFAQPADRILRFPILASEHGSPCQSSVRRCWHGKENRET